MTRIEAVYHIRSSADTIASRAEALAIEQSIEMPLSAVHDAHILAKIAGEVRLIEPLGECAFSVTIGLAADTVDGDAGQLLNMLFGNSSLHEDVVLVDFELPVLVCSALGNGPRVGLDGLRKRVGAKMRALTCAALKPQGLSPDELGKLAEALALGGLDYIKDDHGLADQTYSPFSARIRSCAAAVRRAQKKTGHPTRYVPSLTGNLDQVRSRIGEVSFAPQSA
jgi:ribulose-bisphosphate carboxylase large chain